MDNDYGRRGLEMQEALYDEALEPMPRGEDHTPFVSSLITHLMRLGFGLQLLSMFMTVIFFIGYGGRQIFTFQHQSDLDKEFHLTLVCCLLVWLAGTGFLALFQAFVADDSKWTIGFRTGSKMLSAAVQMDIVASCLRLVQYLHVWRFWGLAWWTRFSVSQSAYTLFNIHNFISAVSLFLYGLSFFYMETYHDQGTDENLARRMMVCFVLGALGRTIEIFTNCGSLITLILTASALLMAFYWSLTFEPMLTRYSPELHSRCINTDILPGEKDLSHPNTSTKNPYSQPVVYQTKTAQAQHYNNNNPNENYQFTNTNQYQYQ